MEEKASERGVERRSGGSELSSAVCEEECDGCGNRFAGGREGCVATVSENENNFIAFTECERL